jgi:hypothetical protein
LEELLLKDNENIPVLDDLPLQSTEPRGFSPADMVRCEECLRANPPTRLECLYCGKALPVTEATSNLARPSLRPLETWEQGYNNILVHSPRAEIADESIDEIANLLRLESEDAKRILAAVKPLPLARTATAKEAELIEQRLRNLGLETVIVLDRDLDAAPRNVRALDLRESDFIAYRTGGAEVMQIPWSDVSLLMAARLLTKQFEIKERKTRRAENEILDTIETTMDEAVVDVYTSGHSLRISANSFDFSCLGERKSLLAKENFQALVEVLRERAPQAEYDDSYDHVRRMLEPVWPFERQTQSAGWRRQWPGKFSTGEIIKSSTESQFTRYSRLVQYLRSHSPDQNQ